MGWTEQAGRGHARESDLITCISRWRAVSVGRHRAFCLLLLRTDTSERAEQYAPRGEGYALEAEWRD